MKTSRQNQVGNFEKLVNFANAQGAVYNPSKASIKSAALQTLLTQAQVSIQAAYVARTAYVNALHARQQALASIPKLATRMIGILQASGVSPETMQACKAIKRRYHSGKSKIKETTSATPAPSGAVAQRTIGQSDVDSMIANLHQLVILATSDALYKPNETELQAAGLNTFITSLRDKNKAVSVAQVAMNEAHRTLDNVLYSVSGIYGQASATKGYIKALFGYTSSKFKEVSSIRFKKVQ